ncbi:hypothetical protein BV898_14103 [Hypsibius exemplaris]|uniref:Uncharacterized protein n=1 Tax=Hypsibius exemplaris TaxID=2072580 RepID=A0A1W0W8S4_HYPEX|nr:hypothetical protein BV898_14103 [Hypsibius exemplaris]
MSVNEERSRLKSLLMDARQVSMWDGEKFVVKPIQLTKISLAAFRGATTSTTVIVNIQMKVARTTSELRTRINVPEKSATEGEMPGQAEYGKQTSHFEAIARNEISRISETLRDIKANLSGSEALVQQNFAVLSAANSRNDGQLANFSVTIQGLTNNFLQTETEGDELGFETQIILNKMLFKINKLNRWTSENKFFSISSSLIILSFTPTDPK